MIDNESRYGENGFWRSALSPRGRNGRGRFWLITVLSGIAGAVGAFTVVGLFEFESAALLFALALVIAVFVVGLINRIRRPHDLGHSGWWMLLVVAFELPLTLLAYAPTEGADPSPGKGLSALFSLGMLIAFGTIPGQPHANRYGNPPGRKPAASETTGAPG